MKLGEPSISTGVSYRGKASCIACMAVSWVCMVAGVSAEDDAVKPPTPAQKKTIDAFIESALWWLPEDTETVAVARGPFDVPTEPTEDSQSLSRQREVISLMPLALGFDQQLPGLLGGHTVLAGVEGSRNFGLPVDIGLSPYEGCQLLLFDGEVTAFMKKAASTVTATKEINGAKALVIEADAELTPWTVYIVHPMPNLLLVATHEGYLKTVLARRAKRPAKRAFPENLPEWKHVDKSARFWALRHFKNPPAERDPTSPFVKGYPHSDPKAVGLVFAYDPKRGNTAVVTYLSGAADAEDVLRFWNMPEAGLAPKIDGKAKGITEIRTDVSQPEVAAMFHFVLLMVLGHAVAP